MFDNVFFCVVMKTNKTNNNSNSNKDQHHNKKVITPQSTLFMDSFFILYVEKGRCFRIRPSPHLLNDGAFIKFTSSISKNSQQKKKRFIKVVDGGSWKGPSILRRKIISFPPNMFQYNLKYHVNLIFKLFWLAGKYPCNSNL